MDQKGLKEASKNFRGSTEKDLGRARVHEMNTGWNVKG